MKFLTGLILIIAGSVVTAGWLAGSREVAELPEIQEQAAVADESVAAKEVTEGSRPRNRAPDFTLRDLKGETVSLRPTEETQKPTLLVFWATWCPACVAEIPALNRFNTEYAGKGVRALSVSVDRAGTDLAGFASARGITYTVLHDTDQSIARTYRVSGIPNVLVIDRAGIVRYNGHSVEKAREEIDTLLKNEV